MEWNLMDSMPPEEVEVLVSVPYPTGAFVELAEVFLGSWAQRGRRMDIDPTHWMHKPEPPT